MTYRIIEVKLLIPNTNAYTAKVSSNGTYAYKTRLENLRHGDKLVLECQQLYPFQLGEFVRYLPNNWRGATGPSKWAFQEIDTNTLADLKLEEKGLEELKSDLLDLCQHVSTRFSSWLVQSRESALYQRYLEANPEAQEADRRIAQLENRINELLGGKSS